MQKGGGWVEIACKIAYVLNGRPPREKHMIIGLNTVDSICVGAACVVITYSKFQAKSADHIHIEENVMSIAHNRFEPH